MRSAFPTRVCGRVHPRPEEERKLMRRRTFITLVGGAAVWPLIARAQQLEQIRRIGVLFNVNADDPGQQNNLRAFAQALQQLGWTDGSNVRIDIRWAGGDASAIRRYAEDLVALA